MTETDVWGPPTFENANSAEKCQIGEKNSVAQNTTG